MSETSESLFVDLVNSIYILQNVEQKENKEKAMSQQSNNQEL